jgi:hypothetical protein
MYITAIDIGVLNLALVLYYWAQEGPDDVEGVQEGSRVISCTRVDITVFDCKPGCKLYHDSCMTDYLEHMFVNHHMYFNHDGPILIERQPPMGLVVVEQLIFSRYRSRSILMSPNSMHAYFDIGHYDYEMRKKATIRLAHWYLKDQSGYASAERKHDIADAMCFVLYYIHKCTEKQLESQAASELSVFTQDISCYTYRS